MDVPLPLEAMLSLPGLDLAYLMKSATVLMFSSVSFFAATLMFFVACCGAGAWLYDTPRGRAQLSSDD